MGGLRAVMRDGFIRLERPGARAGRQLLQSPDGEVLEEANPLFEKVGGVHG